MNGLISLWTQTTKFRVRREILLTATLSILHAKRSFRTVELCTDWLGMHIAHRLGWDIQVTKMSTDLHTLDYSVVPQVWALGKFYAMLSQSRPFCQFDLDVFIHKPLPQRLQAAAMFAQSVDFPYYYSGHEIQKALELTGMPAGGQAYNCGIIGGCDIGAIHRYCRESISMAMKFFRSPINGTAASMVVEQYHLGDFIRRNKIRLETLLPANPSEWEAAEAGYTHLHGESKLQPRIVERVEWRMQESFPEEYKTFQKGWFHLSKEFNLQA